MSNHEQECYNFMMWADYQHQAQYNPELNRYEFTVKYGTDTIWFEYCPFCGQRLIEPINVPREVAWEQLKTKLRESEHDAI